MAGWDLELLFPPICPLLEDPEGIGHLCPRPLGSRSSEPCPTGSGRAGPPPGGTPRFRWNRRSLRGSLPDRGSSPSPFGEGQSTQRVELDSFRDSGPGEGSGPVDSGPDPRPPALRGCRDLGPDPRPPTVQGRWESRWRRRFGSLRVPTPPREFWRARAPAEERAPTKEVEVGDQRLPMALSSGGSSPRGARVPSLPGRRVHLVMPPPAPIPPRSRTSWFGLGPGASVSLGWRCPGLTWLPPEPTWLPPEEGPDPPRGPGPFIGLGRPGPTKSDGDRARRDRARRTGCRTIERSGESRRNTGSA